jgi:hypothetical protein
VRARSDFFCAGVFASRRIQRARLYFTNREWGGRWFNGHHMRTWSAPRRAACIGISQQWRAYLTDGNSVTPGQVNSIKSKKEICKLALAGNRKLPVPYALPGYQIRLGYRVFSGLFRMRDGRCGPLAGLTRRRALRRLLTPIADPLALALSLQRANLVLSWRSYGFQSQLLSAALPPATPSTEGSLPLERKPVHSPC